MERLDKTVATCGDLPRSEAAKLIRSGRVTVDGVPCRDPAQKLDPAAHTLTVAGRVIGSAPHRYVMLNKPQGILCVSRDPKAPTVVDLLPPALRRKGMFPAGRLDKDTVGLVLLTDDGDYAHRLLAPRKAVFKRYRAVTAGALSEGDVAAFAEGTSLADGTRCLPAGLRLLTEEAFLPVGQNFRQFSTTYSLPQTADYGFAEIAIQEGRYHQIKRMCEAHGHKILWLKRISIGGLRLDEALAEGDCRELTAEEAARVFDRAKDVEDVCAT